jgi:hypothetical protein
VDLQALGNIGEFVGAIGVIVSLLYLAGQVKQAQRVARAENVREITAGYSRLLLLSIQDPDVTRVTLAGANGREHLSPIDRLRYDRYLGLHVLFFIDCHTAHANGLMNEDLYQRWRTFVAMVLETPGGKEFWTEWKTLYKADIVDALEQLRGKVPPSTGTRASSA